MSKPELSPSLPYKNKKWANLYGFKLKPKWRQHSCSLRWKAYEYFFHPFPLYFLYWPGLSSLPLNPGRVSSIKQAEIKFPSPVWVQNPTAVWEQVRLGPARSMNTLNNYKLARVWTNWFDAWEISKRLMDVGPTFAQRKLGNDEGYSFEWIGFSIRGSHSLRNSCKGPLF